MSTLGNAAATVRDQARRIPVPTLHRKPNRRRSILRSGVVGIGGLALATLGGLACSKRYKTSDSQVLTMSPLDDGRAIIDLDDGTTLVLSAQDWQPLQGLTKGDSVSYRVNRWKLGGIPAGQITRSHHSNTV